MTIREMIVDQAIGGHQISWMLLDWHSPLRALAEKSAGLDALDQNVDVDSGLLLPPRRVRF